MSSVLIIAKQLYTDKSHSNLLGGHLPAHILIPKQNVEIPKPVILLKTSLLPTLSSALVWYTYSHSEDDKIGLSNQISGQTTFKQWAHYLTSVKKM